MIAQIDDGLEYDTETRRVILSPITCWECKGTCKTQEGIRCPNYNRKMHGKACQHCGSRSRDNHKMIAWKTVPCYHCQATGKITPNDFTSFKLTGFLQYFEYKPLERGEKTFNESYIGHGLFAGVTGYTDGKYNDLETMIDDMARDHSQQLGNVVDRAGYLVPTIYYRVTPDGSSYSAYAAGARFGIEIRTAVPA